MVGRLVEQQRFGLAEERLREQDAHLLSALQLAHLALVQRIRNVEALEEHGGVAFRRVAVLFADDALELAETHAVLVRHLGLLVQRVAFGQRAPQPMVAHDHGVDDAVAVEGELILTEDAELLRPDDGAALRLGFAGEQLHERRLAGAIRPGQTVSPVRRKRRRHIVEENLRPEPHGDSTD